MAVGNEPVCLVVLERAKAHSQLGGKPPLREMNVLASRGDALPGQAVRLHREELYAQGATLFI